MTDKQIARLKKIAVELQWMARRYADERRTSAVLTFNECTRDMIAMGIQPKCSSLDEIIWARDGGGRAFDGLTEDEATPGTAAAIGRRE